MAFSLAASSGSYYTTYDYFGNQTDDYLGNDPAVDAKGNVLRFPSSLDDPGSLVLITDRSSTKTFEYNLFNLSPNQMGARCYNPFNRQRICRAGLADFEVSTQLENF